MKTCVLTFAALVFTMGIFPAGVLAADPAVSGVVDLTEIQKESKATQSIRREQDNYLSSYRQNAVKQEKQLSRQEENLLRKRKLLSEKAYKEKVQEFRKKAIRFQRDIQRKRQLLELATRKAMGEFTEKNLTPVIRDIAEDKGISLVLNKGQTIFFNSDMEITEPVLKKLNDSYPSVEFPDPESLANQAQQ